MEGANIAIEFAGEAHGGDTRIQEVEAEHALLRGRLSLLSGPVAGYEAQALWSRLGVADAARVADLDVAAVVALRPGRED